MRTRVKEMGKIVVFPALLFIFMITYSGYQEFWYDEVYQLGLVNDSTNVMEMLMKYAQLKDYTPPLYALMAYGWVRIVPFSFRYMLLLPEILTAMGTFVVGMIGKEVGGKRTAFLTQMFASLSPVLILSCGYEFRSYGLYFFAAALVILCLTKSESWERKKSLICMTLALTLLLYSHYYGAVIMAALFVMELIFVLKKKRNGKFLLCYVVAGICFLPWLLAVMVNHTRSLTEFWVEPPELQSILKLITYLCSENVLLLLVFALGVTGICVETKRSRIQVYLLGHMGIVIGAMFLYGAYINPSGGIFYNRYFVGLLPGVFTIMAMGMEKMIDQSKRNFQLVVGTIFLVLFVMNGTTFMKEIKKDLSFSYVKSVKAMSKCEDISAKNAIIVTTDNPCVTDGVYMYFTHMTGMEVEIISQYDQKFHERISNYDTLYLFQGRQTLTEKTEEVLKDYEKIRNVSGKRVRQYQRINP